MKPAGEVQRVADEVLRRIVTGGYSVGLRLPAESELAAEFACGRSTVREALRYLTGLGVVQSRRGSGARVLDFRREGTPALLPWYVLAGRFDRPADALAKEFLRVRTLLACEAVRLAALYGEGRGLKDARAALARAPSLTGDAVAHVDNDLEIFRALVASSAIWPAVWLSNGFWSPMRELQRQINASLPFIPPDYQPAMERVLAAVERRDAATAEAELAAFYQRVDATLLGALSAILGAMGAQASAPPIRFEHRRPLMIGTLASAVAAIAVTSSVIRNVALGYPKKSFAAAKNLSRKEQAIVAACADAFFPAGGKIPYSGSQAGLVVYMDRYLGRMPRTQRVLVRLLLRLLEHGPLAFGPRRVRFTDLTHAERMAALDDMRTSEIYFRRIAFLSMRTMLTMGYLANPDVARAMGMVFETAPFAEAA